MAGRFPLLPDATRLAVDNGTAALARAQRRLASSAESLARAKSYLDESQSRARELLTKIGTMKSRDGTPWQGFGSAYTPG